MKNFKLKLAFLVISALMVLLLLGVNANATNEKIEIVKSGEDYLIYVENQEKTDFYFAFSDDSSTDASSLVFRKHGTDTEGNSIAYINSGITNTKYIWIKLENKIVLNATEVDLANAIEKSKLEEANEITKIIKVDTTKTNTTETMVNDVKQIENVGTVKILEDGNFEYQITRLPSEKFNKLNSLAELISKFNSATPMYKKIQTLRLFTEEFYTAKNELDFDNWQKVENNEIKQPSDAEDGEKYILWLKEGRQTFDAQFLTSRREVSEEKITETITTKLPVTYDNNILLIALAVVVFAIIVVCIRIKTLQKNQEK